jgi:uncharacterized membrane protein (UPF0127 family)
MLRFINRLLLCGLLIACGPAIAAAKSPLFKHDRLSIETAQGPQAFSVEIAESPEALRQGLMHRKTMPDSHGMLFLFEREQLVRMWMKDTPMPLDMLFIDGTGRIVHIDSQATPYSTRQHGIDQPVRAVLELKGGTAERRGIASGDHILYSGFGS